MLVHRCEHDLNCMFNLKKKRIHRGSTSVRFHIHSFTFSGHLGQQLVCQFLREVHSLSKAQGSIRPFSAEKVQILAHVSQTDVCQGRGRCFVLRNTNGLGYEYSSHITSRTSTWTLTVLRKLEAMAISGDNETLDFRLLGGKQQR